LNSSERLPDFSKAPAVDGVLAVPSARIDADLWKDRAVKLSQVFSEYPKVLSSGVEVQISRSKNYLVNSEGAVVRTPENLASVRIQARGLAPDGTSVRDGDTIAAFEPAGLPDEAELRRQTKEVAEHVSALTQAPPGEAYDGPVLFEARAAAQLFAHLL